jgi:hypothetical protein
MKRNIYFYLHFGVWLLLFFLLLINVIIPVLDRILDGMMPYIP